MSDFASLPTGAVHSDGQVTFGSDSRLHVTFIRKSVRNGYQSEVQGRPIFEGRDFIRIVQPGERDVLEREVNDLDRHRFARQWQAYQNQQEQAPEGTPLAILFPNEPEIVDMLKAQRIHTVEQLAALSDSGLQNIGLGAREFQKRAVHFMEAAEKGRPAAELQRELTARDDRIAVLEQQIAQLLAAQEAKPRRGRPPGSASAATDEGE